MQFAAMVNVTDAIPPSTAPLIALCHVIASFPVLSQVLPPPVDVDVPVDVPVEVPVLVPVEVLVEVPVDVLVEVPVDVLVEVPVVVPVLVLVDVPVVVPVLVLVEDPPDELEEPPEVDPLSHLTQKTFCFSPPGEDGRSCFTVSL